MDFGLQNKVAMVAAGTLGIGLATAKELAREGCHVAICGRQAERFGAALELLHETSDLAGHVNTQHRADVVDVTDPAALDTWFTEIEAHLGPVDILVTNTGGPPAGPWTDMTDEQWQTGFESTLLNVVRMVRRAAPGMKARGWGRIIHITSVAAVEPQVLLPISATLRGGLMNLTRLQSTELAPYGITVNSVLPGHTMTDRQVHLAEVRAAREGISVDEALAKQVGPVPTGRFGTPEEIAAAITFLASSRASYINGVNLLVDGGVVRTAG